MSIIFYERLQSYNFCPVNSIHILFHCANGRLRMCIFIHQWYAAGQCQISSGQHCTMVPSLSTDDTIWTDTCLMLPHIC